MPNELTFQQAVERRVALLSSSHIAWRYAKDMWAKSIAAGIAKDPEGRKLLRATWGEAMVHALITRSLVENF